MKLKETIVKLLEKIVKQNEEIINLLKKKEETPVLPYQESSSPFTPSVLPTKINVNEKSPWESQSTYPRITNDVVICFHCGKDTGIPNILGMYIPPQGIKCPHCKKVVIEANNITY